MDKVDMCFEIREKSRAYFERRETVTCAGYKQHISHIPRQTVDTNYRPDIAKEGAWPLVPDKQTQHMLHLQLRDVWYLLNSNVFLSEIIYFCLKHCKFRHTNVI